MLKPGQKPTENRRTKSCPGVGQCTEVRAWKPGKYPVIYKRPRHLTSTKPDLISTKSTVAMYPTKNAPFPSELLIVPTVNTNTWWDSFG